MNLPSLLIGNYVLLCWVECYADDTTYINQPYDDSGNGRWLFSIQNQHCLQPTIFTMSFSSFPILHNFDANEELPFGTAADASSSAVNQREEVHRRRGRPPVYSSDAERTQARREKTAGRLRRYRSVSRSNSGTLQASQTEQYESELDIPTIGEDNTSETSNDDCFSNTELVFRPNNQPLPSVLPVEIPDWVMELPLSHRTRGT